MSEPHLESIPVEVGALILENIPDMNCLWALIQASPHLHCVFRDYRSHILSIVILRDIGPDLMVDAVAALNSSRFTTIQKVDGEDVEIPIRGLPKTQALEWMESYYLPRSGVMRWVDGYLDEYEMGVWEEWKESHQVEEPDNFPLSEDILPLWELHKNVKVIADLYVQETLPVFTQSFRFVTEPPAPQISYTLKDTSTIERQRIFRGIYRFVIFGNLFAPSAEVVWSEDELCERFLCRFQGWEVEEISCIYDFIADRVFQKWKEIDDYEFNCLDGPPNTQRSDSVPNTGNPHRRADFSAVELVRDDLRGKLTFFAALPVQDLLAMFQAKGETLRELVLKWASVNQDRRVFLGEALNVDPGMFSVIDGGTGPRSDADFRKRETEFTGGEDPDDWMDGNVGLYWSTGGHSREMYVHGTSTDQWRGEDFEGFRRAGYVFWDAETWQSYNMLE